jgi:hypothetical protein
MSLEVGSDKEEGMGLLDVHTFEGGRTEGISSSLVEEGRQS